MSKPLHVAILQSSYIPWRGYFGIIDAVDVFIFLDTVQFTARDWRTRNRIKTPQGPVWLTIPCGKARIPINEVPLPTGWEKKHWETIRRNYGKAPYFKAVAPFIEEQYFSHSEQTLSGFNQRMTAAIHREFFGGNTQFVDAATLSDHGAKTERLIHLLKQVGATSYLSGPSAKDYIEEADFADAGIGLSWADYGSYRPYPQIHGEFDPAVSVLDLLFMCGPDAKDHVRLGYG